MKTTQQVTNVSVRNIKRIAIANVPISKPTTVIGGKNAQGKSSFCDAVAMALGGKKCCPIRPLKDGEDIGEVKVTIEGTHPRLPGKNVVHRIFRRGKDGGIKTEMKIVSEDGEKAPEPQTILSEMIAASMWDPTEFIGRSDKQQFEHLRQLLGVDTAALDKHREAIYAERTEVNRTMKECEGKLAGSTQIEDEDIPEKVDLVQLMQDRDSAARKIRDAEEQRRELSHKATTLEQTIRNRESTIDEMLKEIADLKNSIDGMREAIEEESEELRKLQETTVTCDMTHEDVAQMTAQMEAGQSQNEERQKLLAQQKAEAEWAEALKKARAKSSALTGELESIDRNKSAMLESIKWPVEGLGFGNGVVLFNGVPLSQSSSAEQLRVAAGIELAGDRPLPLLIIKNGSHLDEDSLAMLGNLVAERGAQLFLERVGKGPECDIVFEDGIILE